MFRKKYLEEVAFRELKRTSEVNFEDRRSEYYFCWCSMLWITVTIALVCIGLAMAGVFEHPDLPDDELGSSHLTSRRGKCESEHHCP